MFQVEFYKTEQGASEVADFVEGLIKKYPQKEARIIYNSYKTCLKILDMYGLRPKRPHYDKVRDDIWELRPCDYRILFFVHRHKVILLSVLRKTKNDIQQHEIDKAIERKKDWENRFVKGSE